jgi:hypothetical protein
MRFNQFGRVDEDDAALEPARFPDVATPRERDEAEMRAWPGTLSDTDLVAEVDSTLTRDRRPWWHYLMHILTHAAQQGQTPRRC